MFNFDDNRILIFGKNGQLATSFKKYTPNATFLGQDDLSSFSEDEISEVIQNIKPALVINTTAFTAVDQAETQTEKARHLNTDVPFYIANAASKADSFFLHFSTDYVFDGRSDLPYTETDVTNPINNYGHTKRNGEIAVFNTPVNAMIIRTSWLYNETGNNFLNTMLRLFTTQTEVRVVNDQVGAPTFTDEIVKGLVRAQWQSGIFHLTSQGQTTWFDFAREILTWAQQQNSSFRNCTLLPIKSSEFAQVAKRPLNSRLNCEKSRSLLGIQLPEWSVSLQHCLKNKTI